MSGLQAGDFVRLAPGGPVGSVTYAGSCGYGGCRYGDSCVTVKWERYNMTTNHHAEKLERADHKRLMQEWGK